MRQAVRWGMLAGACVLATAATARADDTEAREAQARFEEGLARVRSGDFDGARTSFTQAYAVLHKPDILWNLALCEQKSGYALDALGHFKKLVHDAPQSADRTSAQKHVSELMARTAHIEVLAPAGAQVSVDGVAQGMAPLADTVDVDPGKHHIEVRNGAAPAKSVDADAVVGQVAHVSFLAADAPPVVAAGTPTPPATDQQPPSTDTPPPMHSDATFWNARGITVVTLGGLAVVSAGAALGLGQASDGDASTAATLRKQNPSCEGVTTGGCGQLASTTQSQHSAFVASEGMWIASGVLAAGAIATWFLWPRASIGSQSRITVVPSVGAGSAGALAVGSF